VKGGLKAKGESATAVYAHCNSFLSSAAIRSSIVEEGRGRRRSGEEWWW
jgi:hypothetical protein